MSGIKLAVDQALLQASFPGLSGLRILKSGGQKDVYAAESAEYGPVVLKLMPIGPDGLSPRIRREIEIVTSRAFAGVPRIFGQGTVSLGGVDAAFIVEQRIEGRELRAILVDEGRQAKGFVVAMLKSLLATLCELEANRIVHRDIKPDNIVVDGQGRFWLLDFGIARDLDAVSLTLTSDKLGPLSPGYAAPEQVMNFKRQIDTRSDMFSLGVTAYELLAGRHPFAVRNANPLAVLVESVTADADTLEIDGDPKGELAEFVKTLMNRQQTFRPPTARMALDWLNSIS